jgi:hypothetical protein
MTGQRSWTRELGIAWIHLAVLWAFAFAQPLLEVLADSPEFFVARRNTGLDIVVMACALIIVPPSVLVLLEALLLRVPAVRRRVHLVLVAALGAAFALQIWIDLLGAAAAVLITLALVAGFVLALGYARLPAVPTALSVLAPAPLAIVLYFLLLSPVAKLVLPQSESAASQTAAGTGAPVVMVVFDEFSSAGLLDSQGHIDRSRFPNFAALADHSTWYRNATTVADRTSRAVPALLTGRLADAEELPTAADQPNSLFTLLGDRYAFRVEEPATDICPERLCGEEERPPLDDRLSSLVSDLSVVSLHLLLPEELADDLPPIDRSFGDFRGQGFDNGDRRRTGSRDLPGDALRNRVELFDQLVRGLQPDSHRPTLHLLHVGLPHRPWEYLPDGRQYRPVRGGPPGESLIDDPAPATQMLQQYMLQLTYLDRLLGGLLRRMRALGLDQSAALVVTADHGVSFRPGDQLRSATQTNIGEIAGVPLFIKAPGQRRGRIDDSHVRTVDVVPTLADDLELTPRWKTDGHSLARGGGAGPASVRVKTIFDDTTSVSFADFVRARDAAAAHIHDTFGPGISGLFELGSDRGVIGAAVGRLQTASAGGTLAELDAPQQLAAVDLRDVVLPVSVSGKLTGTPADRLRLAIALNGRVSAVTSAYRDRGELVFTALVPPSALRSGSNSVSVFAIRGRQPHPTLLSLQRQRQLDFGLEERSGTTVIVAPHRREIVVDPKAAQGFVEEIRAAPEVPLVVSGWALTSRKTPIDRVLLFVGDRFIAASEPSREREDVAEHFGNSALNSGYSLWAAPGALGDEGKRAVRVFAVTGSRASELRRLQIR